MIQDDVQVQDFLDRCQEAGRQVLEKKIVALRSPVFVSLVKYDRFRWKCHPSRNRGK